MEKATKTIRRSGAFLLSYGSKHQDLNLIITELGSIKAQIKAIRDSQQTVLQDITNWTCAEENRPLQELLLHLSDLNSLWSEVQTNFADKVVEFKRQFGIILEGEKNLDTLRNELSNFDVAEEKALKKLKKAQKKNVAEDIRAATAGIEQCKAEKESVQNKVSAKVKENEAVKLILMKDGLLKLTEAYLELAHKCNCIFEAQKEIVKSFPDVEDKEIHELQFDGLSGAKAIIQRAQMLVKDYNVSHQSALQRNNDPPPPYSPDPTFSNPPFNPYYMRPNQTSEASTPGNSESSHLYPTQDLAGAFK